MADPTTADLTKVIAELQRRLDVLERAPKAWAPGTVREPQYRPAGNKSWDTPIAITSASYDVVWEAQWRVASHDAFVWDELLVCDVGTTGSAYLSFNSTTTGTTNTPAVSVTSTQQWFTWHVDMRDIWTPNTDEGVDDHIWVQVWAKRNSGAGNVNVYPPDAVQCVTASFLEALKPDYFAPPSTVSPEIGT